MDAIIAALIGIFGVLVGVYFGQQREREHWRRELQINLSSNALAALQSLVREITTVAYLDPLPDRHAVGRPGVGLEVGGRKDLVPDAADTRREFYGAVTAWNTAMYQLLVAGSPEFVDYTRRMDKEIDRLLDLAIKEKWTRETFRNERRTIGRMMAEFVGVARAASRLEAIDVATVWTWDE